MNKIENNENYLCRCSEVSKEDIINYLPLTQHFRIYLGKFLKSFKY